MPITVQHQPNLGLLGAVANQAGQNQYINQRRREEEARQLALMQMAQRERMQERQIGASQQSQMFGAAQDWGKTIFSAAQNSERQALQNQHQMDLARAQGEQQRANQLAYSEAIGNRQKELQDYARVASTSDTYNQRWQALINDQERVGRLTEAGQGDLQKLMGQRQKVLAELKGAPPAKQQEAMDNFMMEHVAPFIDSLPLRETPENRVPGTFVPEGAFKRLIDPDGNPGPELFPNLEPGTTMGQWLQANRRLDERDGTIAGEWIPELKSNGAVEYKYHAAKKPVSDSEVFKTEAAALNSLGRDAGTYLSNWNTAYGNAAKTYAADMSKWTSSAVEGEKRGPEPVKPAILNMHYDDAVKMAYAQENNFRKQMGFKAVEGPQLPGQEQPDTGKYIDTMGRAFGNLVQRARQTDPVETINPAVVPPSMFPEYDQNRLKNFFLKPEMKKVPEIQAYITAQAKQAMKEGNREKVLYLTAVNEHLRRLKESNK